MDEDAKKNESSRRSYLRVSADRPGKAIVFQGKTWDISIKEISSRGISFFVKAPHSLPPKFDVVFKLSTFGPEIRVFVEARNEAPIGDQVRFGCAFLNIGHRESTIIESYICRKIDMEAWRKVVAFAAFLCVADAIVRAVFCAIDVYYQHTPFGLDINMGVVSMKSNLALTIYGLSAASAFALTDRLIGVNEKWRMPFILTALGFAGTFLLLKEAACWLGGMGDVPYMLVKGVLWTHIALFVMVVAAMWAGHLSIARKKVISSLIENHKSGGPKMDKR